MFGRGRGRPSRRRIDAGHDTDLTRQTAIAKSGYGMPGKHYIDSYLIKHVVLLTNQKDYVHYPARATGHHHFDFFHDTINTQRCMLFSIRNTRYASRSTLHEILAKWKIRV